MRKNIKVLYLIDSLILAGAQRQLVELILRMSQTRVRPYLISLKYSKISYADKLITSGIKPNYVERMFKFDLVYPAAKIISYIKKNNIDIIHGFMNMGSLFGLIAAKATSRPVISSAIRDSQDTNLKEKYIKIVLSKYSDIIVSNTWAGFKNRFNVIKPNFKVIYNGIDLKKFKKLPIDHNALKKAIGVPTNTFIIGMVASFTRNKDHETLFRAFANLLDKEKNISLILIGDGYNRQKLEDLAKQLNIYQKTHFFGYQQDVVKFYNIMDIHILLTNTDRIAEGFSNAVLEAMACGVPTIATESGGIPELIEHNKDGLLIPPKNPERLSKEIEKLLFNSKIRERIILNAKQKINKFNIDKYTNNYYSLYQKLITRN